MKVEKEVRRIRLVCNHGFLVEGDIHIYQGERTLDFINRTRENFIVITNVKFHYSAKLEPELAAHNNTIILNKLAIEWIEEI